MAEEQFMRRAAMSVLLLLTFLLGAVVLLAAPQQEAKDREMASKTLPTLKLVRIPAKGKAFTMGSPKEEKGHEDDETEHEVTLSADYYLGVTTVTRGQFGAFVMDNGYRTEAEKGDGGYGWDNDKKDWFMSKKYSWRNPGFVQTDEHPVVNVSWNDAVVFCRWLSEKDGREYRLPTEAQWEYACRAGSRTRYSFGNDEEELAKHGNVADAKFRKATGQAHGIKNSDGYAFTAPVGQYQKNAYGLLDMHGNVWQWCSDVYGDYPQGAVTDPQGSAAKEDCRVSRGGSWSGHPEGCRSARRNGYGSSHRADYLGFRLALSVR
jgi:formylglycine-generating enzyme required for sulfatase activity